MNGSRYVLLAAFLANAVSAQAQAVEDVLIKRGEAELTVADMDGRMSRIPESDRATYAHRPENLARLMDQTLLNRQLAHEARASGIDKRPDVQRDLQLAVEEVLAIHRLNILASETPEPDFAQLAKEKYQAGSSEYSTPPRRIVEHVLIGTENRSDAEALELASEIQAKATAPGADFAALVSEFSDDSGKAQNAGRYTIARPGQFVPEFESAAKALRAPGEVSQPVKTKFGYHVIRLVEDHPADVKPFEDVRGEIIAKLMTEHETRLRDSHVRALKSLPETGDEALLIGLRKRYGGEVDSLAGERP
jgi:peptidyl-prolyl cis-trans isomerase C